MVPRANERTFAVDNPENGQELQAREVALFVEGRAGPALRNHDASAPNAPVRGRFQSHVSEVFLDLVAAKSLGEASLMGGGDITIRVKDGGQAKVRSVTAGERPRLRSKRGISVIDDEGAAARLEMRRGYVGARPRSGVHRRYPRTPPHHGSRNGG